MTVELRFHGDWPAADQQRIAAFVDGLAMSGYFRGLKLPVAYHVEPGGLLIDLYAPGADDGRPPCGWHGFRDGRPHIGVASICSSMTEATYSLSHELVETAADPDLSLGEDGEVADHCASWTTLEVAGAPARVARYWNGASCGPAWQDEPRGDPTNETARQGRDRDARVNEGW